MSIHMESGTAAGSMPEHELASTNPTSNPDEKQNSVELDANSYSDASHPPPNPATGGEPDLAVSQDQLPNPTDQASVHSTMNGAHQSDYRPSDEPLCLARDPSSDSQQHVEDTESPSTLPQLAPNRISQPTLHHDQVTAKTSLQHSKTSLTPHPTSNAIARPHATSYTHASITTLPAPIHLLILPYLTYPSARSLRQTSRTLRALYPPRLVALLRPEYEASLLSNILASPTLPCISCTRLKSSTHFQPSGSARLINGPSPLRHGLPLFSVDLGHYNPTTNSYRSHKHGFGRLEKRPQRLPIPVLAPAPGGIERPVCRLCWRTTFGDSVARALEGRRPKSECARCKRNRGIWFGSTKVNIGGAVGIAAGEGGLCWSCSARGRARDAFGRAVESERLWAWVLGAVEGGLAGGAMRLVRRELGDRDRGEGWDRSEVLFGGLFAGYVLCNLGFWVGTKIVGTRVLRGVIGLRWIRRFLGSTALDGMVIILNLFVGE
ncbi:MAG: hypothetical protein MMC23_007504 [Stictis urceolatum]|nr:hypothetical protein [Stictis urceolata]